MNKIAKILAPLVMMCACQAPENPAEPQASVETPSAALHHLVEEYFERALELNPVFATSIGDLRYNHRYPNTIGKQWLADALALEEEYLHKVKALDVSQFDEAAQLTYDIFVYNRELAIEGLQFPSELLPISQFGSPPVEFGRLGTGDSVQPFNTTQHYDDFLQRIEGFKVWVDQAIVNLETGLDTGVVQPRVIIEKALPQLASFVVQEPTQSVFYQPLKKFPESVSATDRQRLTAAYQRAIREVLVPAYRRLHAYLEKQYLPKARTTVGMHALPQGERWYAYLARASTTTTLTPAEIHDIGLKEMVRIQAELERVKTQLGFKGTLREFIEALRADPRFVYRTPEELLAGYQALQDRVTAALPHLFAIQPKMPFEVRPVEAFRERSEASASYQPGTPDGSRPGIFYVNTYDLNARPRYLMETIFLHEALPGHHLQIALQYELQNLPRFRRFGGDVGYIEGWGLYAESLGKELGLFQDPYQYFGALTAEAWRAARLVVDTGLHAKGWTREQAIDYLRTHTALGETDIVAEVERYIAIPGQALAYKIGQLKIRELRARAEKELGRKFDVREFHTQILQDGSMPLKVLEAKIDRWIARARR